MNLNPIRYRGYYLDSETGLYHCQSRYYDSVTSRFVNADSVIDNRTCGSQNVFAYCGNNPVDRSDSGGQFWETVLDIVSVVYSAYQMVKNPTLSNAASLAWDIASAVIPFVPGSYVAKGVKAATKIVDKADDVVDTAKKMQTVREIGITGETIADITKNTTRIKSLTGTAHYRIPDELKGNILKEVKNCQKLSYTNQLKDFVAYSQLNGLEMQLVTNAKLTRPLQ